MRSPLAGFPVTVQGIILMVFATVCFTSMQTMIRIVAGDPDNPLHPLEVTFLRNVFLSEDAVWGVRIRPPAVVPAQVVWCMARFGWSRCRTEMS